MTNRIQSAIVGAGPFGLSLGAHLRNHGGRVFGTPMQTWRESMPPGMLLRSAWEETSLSAPGGTGTIDEWAQATGEARQEPIPLELFLRYADWFRERFVGELDRADVEHVEQTADGRFRVTATTGEETEADRLVLAVGVMPFRDMPGALGELLGEGVDFATGTRDFAELRDRRVVVVGGGQSALETAGRAAQAGADVELITRSQVRWFADREPHNPRSVLGRHLYKLAYPAVGYGPPPLNRLVLHPDLYAKLPSALRSRLSKRLLRSGGSPWLRELVDGHVGMRLGTHVEGVDRANGRLRVRLDDGSETEADAVLVATGYRFSVDRISFLAPELRSQITTTEGWPTLDRYFRSVGQRRIHLVGYPAEGRFGPISRYVLGADFAAKRVAEALTS